MHVLEFAYFGPQYVKSIIPIATSASLSAWGIGWGEIQRQCIYSDPKYQDGYYPPDQPPIAGLATARIASMLSFRSSPSFQARFGRHLQSPCASKEIKNSETRAPGALFSVQSYLRYQGDKFVNRFDANCYVALTNKLDSHDLARGRAVSTSQALSQIQQPALILAIRSDILFTFDEQLELQRGIPHAIFREIVSDDGHDGFLLETGQINRHVREFLDQVATGPRGKLSKISWLRDSLKLGMKKTVAGIGIIAFCWTLANLLAFET